MDFLVRARKLPPAPAPNDDPSKIKGNLSLEKKQLAVNMLSYNIGNLPGMNLFGNSVLKNMVLVEVYVRKVGMGSEVELIGEDDRVEVLRSVPLETQIVFEMRVDGGMPNLHNILAGACYPTLIELGTYALLFVVGLVTGVEPHSMSTAMNMTFHSAAIAGTSLKMVVTSLLMGRHITGVRCEIYDQNGSQLIVSAMHNLVPSLKLKKSSDVEEPFSKL